MVIIEPANALDSPADQLRDLLTDIESSAVNVGIQDLELVISNEPTEGVANDWFDTLHVYLPSIGAIKDTIWFVVIPNLVLYMRKRFRRPNEEKRPRRIAVYGLDGKLRKYIEIADETADEVLVEMENFDHFREPPIIDDNLE